MMTTRATDNVFIKFELPADLKARFEIQCKRAGIKMAETMRLMVEEFTRQNEDI